MPAIVPMRETLFRRYRELVDLDIGHVPANPGPGTTNPLALLTDSADVLQGLKSVSCQHDIFDAPGDLALLDLVT